MASQGKNPVVGIEDDYADSESDSEYFDAEDLASPCPSIATTEQTELENSKLILAIRSSDTERVLQAMNGCNKWVVNQKIWYLKGKENIHKENTSTVEEFGEPNEERIFLEECIKMYSRCADDVTASDEEVASQTDIQTKTNDHKINPKLFELPIYSNVPDIEHQTAEADAPGSTNAQLDDSFLACFRLLLKNKYSHLTEDQIFKQPAASSDNSAASSDNSAASSNSSIVSEFESLKKCDTLEHFQDFFSHLTTVTGGTEGQLKHSFSKFFNKTKAKQVRILILSELETFFVYLFDTRSQTMHRFEQFECEIYKQIISFEFLSSNCSTFKCELLKVFKECLSIEWCITSQNGERIIQKLQDRHSRCSQEQGDVYRKELYQKELELYQKLLEVISRQRKLLQVDTTVIEQILNSNINHFSYLHENLTRLIKLLWQIIQPYSVSSQNRDRSTVYTISMVAGVSSSALAVFHEWISTSTIKLAKTLQNGDEMRLCADTVLYVDSDIRHPKLDFQGVSVACIAPLLICKKMHKLPDAPRLSVSINTDGEHKKFKDRSIKAKSGDDGTETAKNGKTGEDGQNGQNGNAGGHILLVAFNIDHDDFKLSANGSPGEDGQNGGDGGAGWTPPTVKDIDGFDPTFKLGRFQTDSAVVISFGIRGVDSGHGGDPGMGGAAGKSGVSGKIEILDLNNGWKCQASQKQSEDGKPGQPGNPGKGGKHARHGIDWGKHGDTLWLWRKVITLAIHMKRPENSITSIRGELCHDEIPYDRSILRHKVEQYEKPAKGKKLRQVKEKDHPDFVDRGFNKDGQTAKTKVIRSLAKENIAVDKQACFQALLEQCHLSLQHWNYKSHNRLLGVFARNVGEHHQFMPKTQFEANRSKHVMWISQIHKLSEVSVTCEAKQSTKVQPILMKDPPEQTRACSISFDTLASESTETGSLSIDVSSLKQIANCKNIHLENFSLESLLTDDSFDGIIKSLQDIVLAANTEQLHCLKQLELIILIRKSYKIAYNNCESEEQYHIQKLYAIYLDELVNSTSISTLLLIEKRLKIERLLLMLFDLNSIESVLPRDENGTAIKAFFDAISNYNRQQDITLLPTVMLKFQKYHLIMSKTPNYLDHRNVRLFLQTFKENLIYAFQFLYGKFNLVSTFQGIALLPTKSEKILQTLTIEGIPKENRTFGHLDTYFENLTAGKHNMFSDVIDTAVKLLGIVLTTKDDTSPSFSVAYSDFCDFPSLKTVLPAVVAFSCAHSDKHSEKLQKILLYTYSEVRGVLKAFHELLSAADFKSSMSKIGLEIFDFLKAFRQTSIDVAKPQLEALIHILECISNITSELNDKPQLIVICDPSRLLISITEVLEGIYSYCSDLNRIKSKEEDRQGKIECRNQLIIGHVNSIADFHATFLTYPMSCPLPALLRWKKFIEYKFIPKLVKKQELFKNTSESDVFENLCELSIMLKKFNNFLSQVIDSRKHFGVLSSCKNLQMYSLLYKCINTDKLPEALTKDIMVLGKVNGECIQTIVTHFGQIFLSSSQSQLSVEMERFEPKYEFSVSLEEPSANIKPYTLILVNNETKWKLYFSSDDPSCHWREVKVSEIKDIRKGFKKVDPFDMKNKLNKEQKAHLVSMFKFDTEYDVSHKVYFGSQLLLSKTHACLLSMLSIDVKTCAIKISDGTVLEYDDSIGQSILVVLCNSTKEGLEKLRSASYLNISEDQFTNEIKGSVAVFVVKYPDQPAIVKTVTKCGERKVLKHQYSLSLYKSDLSFRSLLSDCSGASYRLVLIDNSESSDFTFLDILQPISNLLKAYQEQYDILLPTDILNNSLKSTIKLCPTVCCRQSIIKLVRSVRRAFVQECMKQFTVDLDHINVRTLRGATKHMIFPDCTSLLIEDIHLIAIESFLCFKLGQRNATKPLELCDIRKTSFSFNVWEKTLVMKTFTRREIISICKAFVYLKNSLYIENVLEHEVGSIRYNMYQSIMSGLLLLPADLIDEQINSKVSDHLKACILQQYVEEDCDNDQDIKALLEMIKINKSLWKLIDKRLIEAGISTGRLRVYLCQQFFTWFNNEIYKIFRFLQDILSHYLFSCHEKKVSLIDECLYCLCNRADEALKSPIKWDSLVGLIQVFHSFVHDLNARIQKRLTYCTSEENRIINLAKLVKLSPDVLMIVTIVQELPSDLWLGHLFAYNLFELCVKQYGYVDELDELHNKLLLIDQTFLQILYNVFQDYISNASGSDSSSCSFKQLSVIVDLLRCIEPCTAAFSALCRTSICQWEKELPTIHFKQYVDHWKDLTESNKQRTIYMMNRVRLDSGMTHVNYMSVLYKIRSKYVRGNIKDSKLLMSVFESLYYKRISLEQLKNIASASDCKQWSRCIRALVNMTNKYCESRKIGDVLDLIHNQVESCDSEISIHDINVIRNDALEVFKHLEYCSMVPNATERELKQFFSLLQRCVTIEEKMQWLEKYRVLFVSSIIKSWILSSAVSSVQQAQVPYSTQIVSLLLFLHYRNDGLLQQVKTGEGKTLIVGMLAGAKSLLGFNVDVVSSNRDLAQSGMEKCQPFFSLLGLKAAINCTDDDDTNQQAYKVHIVYGDVGSFQRDILQEESEPGVKVNFRNRYSDPKKSCLIVDEVDSMFLDKAQHILYLSHDSPALKHLETLFLNIWSAMINVVSSDHVENLCLKEVAKQINILIKNDTIPVPDYLKVFCEKKMERWVKNAYHAMTMYANDQFVIDHQKQGNSKVKRIFPIDKQTGIEQYNMKWSNGLSQFLELKYRHPTSSESLKAVFISNKRFFQKYNKQLFGLTGTIGSVTSRKLLQKVYGIITVELPTNKPKRYAQHKSRIAISEQDWCAQICDEISIRTSEQPVLVICENIKRLESIKCYMLSQGKISDKSIINYSRDGDNVEKKFKDQHGAKPGQIVLATNKGGRGTDIVISDEDVPKGLHVILTFLPENTRIEEQAFGRAARAGQAGSGCLIIHVNQQKYPPIFQRLESVEAGTEILVEKEKEERDNTEKDRLSVLQSDSLPRLELEEGLYLLFQKCRKLFAKTLQNLSLMDVRVGTTARSALLGVVTDHWAYWLDSMHAQIHSVSCESEKQLVINLFSKDFPAQGYPLPSSIHDINFFKYPESYVTLGIGFLKDISECPKRNSFDDNESRHLKAALTCFQQADKIGDLTGLPAMASCYCFIKLNPEASRTNMKQARRYLKKARTHLTALKQTLMMNAAIGTQLSKLIDVSQYVHDNENYYTHQVEEKMKVVGLHLHTVELLLGSRIDEHSFMNKSTLTNENISEEQSKQIYCKLVELGFICHNKVRKVWKNESVLKQLITEKIGEQVSPDLIKLVLSEPKIEESDLRGLVNSSDELWDIISPLLETSVNVRVIFASKVDLANLEGDSLITWKLLKLSVETDRIDIPCDDARTSTYKDFLAYLEAKNLCRSTRKGVLKQNVVTMMKNFELGKYENCYKYNANGHKQPLRSYLSLLFEHCQQNEDGFLLEYMLPYANKAFEAKKIHVFLHEQDILKSGQLVQSKYGDHKQFQCAIATSLSEHYSPFQVDFIVKILLPLQGEIRKFERKMQVDFVDFLDLPARPEEISEELAFFTAWHMDRFLSIEQAGKGWWDWNAFACATLGLSQVIGGAALVCFACTAGIGEALIDEGVRDMVYATMSGLTGTMNWKDYIIQKGVMIAIKIVTCGISALANHVSTGLKLGSANPSSVFINATATAAKKFLLNTSTLYISDVVLRDVQERVVNALIIIIDEKILSMIGEKLRSRLKSLAQHVSSDDEFHSNCQRIVDDIRLFLGTNPLVSAELGIIRSQVVSALQNNYKGIAENLQNGNSTKTIRLLSLGAKVAYYTDKVVSPVSALIRVGHGVRVLLDLILPPLGDECVRQANDINTNLIDREAADIEGCLKEFLCQQFHGKLRKAVRFTVKYSLKSIAEASKNALSSAVKNISTWTILMAENDEQASFSTGVARPRAACFSYVEIDTTSENNQDLDLSHKDSFQREILEPTAQTKQRGSCNALKLMSVRKNKKKKVQKPDLVVKPLFLSDNLSPRQLRVSLEIKAFPVYIDKPELVAHRERCHAPPHILD